MSTQTRSERRGPPLRGRARGRRRRAFRHTFRSHKECPLRSGHRALAFILFVCAGSIPNAADAQAWIREGGAGYAELSYRNFSSRRLVGSAGETIARQEYRQHAIAHYGEVGLIDRWLMLVLQAELFQLGSLPGLGHVAGVGDARLALFSGLVESPFRLSMGVQVGVPFGDAAPDPGPEANAVEVATARSLPTGDGEVDLTALVAFGHSVQLGASLQLHVQLVAGYAYRTRGFTDQLVYRGELGMRIRKPVIDRFLVLVRVSGAERLTRVSEPDLSGNGLSVTTVGPEVIARMGGGFSFGFAAEFGLRGKNLRLGTQLKLALSYQWRRSGR